MKTLNKLCSLILLLSFSAQAGLPPTTMKGQSDTSPSVTFNLQAPKKQATRVNATTALIETGNENLVADPGIESNSTTNYSLGTATLTNGIPTGTPTFGSGASGNLSIAASNTTPIAGAYSLNYVSSAATTAGNFVATAALTVDPENRAKVMQFKVKYNVSSGSSNVNFSGTSSNSYGVAVYDVTNSAWLPCAGQFNIIQTGVGEARGTCQTSLTTASARMVVYNVAATAGAATLQLDSFYFGPQITAQGAAITDVESFTPTSNALPGTGTGKRWRVGDRLHFEIQWVLSAGLSGNPDIGGFLPSGLAVDTAKINQTGNRIYMAGATATDATVGDWTGLMEFDSTYTSITRFAGPNAQDGWTPTVPFTWASGDVITARFSLPIVGWSSNSSMSNDTDTRVVAANATFSGNPAAGATFTNWTAGNDTHGAFNTTTGVYTIPVTGWYDIDFVVPSFGAGSSAYSYGQITADGTDYSGPIYVANATIGWTASSKVMLYLAAGKQVSFKMQAQSSPTLTGISGARMAISRRSGPATVAANETVSARYAGTSTSISSTFATVTFSTKSWDTHNAYSGGTYTCPVSGKYRFSASVYLNGGNALGTVSEIQLRKAGSAFSVYSYYAPANINVPLTLNDAVDCLAGQALDIQVKTAATAPSISNSTTTAFFSIDRVGN